MKSSIWNLETNAIQLWYESRHRYLDAAGAIADTFRERYPEFTMDQASTSGIKLSSEEDEINLVYTDSQAHIGGAIDHKSSDSFGEKANFFFETLIKNLGIRLITRMGNRMSHRVEFNSELELDQWLAERIGKLLVAGHHPFSTVDERLEKHVLNDLSFRTNDGKFDFHVHLKKYSRVLSLLGEAKRRFSDQLKRTKLEIHSADLDIDIKTIGAIELSALDPALFFKSNRKLIYHKIVPWIEGSPPS